MKAWMASADLLKKASTCEKMDNRNCVLQIKLHTT